MLQADADGCHGSQHQPSNRRHKPKRPLPTIQSQGHKEGTAYSGRLESASPCSVSLGRFHLVVDLICRDEGPTG